MKVHSNGRVIDYGKKGHPIVSDFYNPEYVVLKQYSKKPKVGDIIQFQVYRKKNQKCGKMIDKNKKVKEETDIDKKEKIVTVFNDYTGEKLGDIKRYWEGNYEQKLHPETTKGFYDSFLEIRKYILKKRYGNAVILIDKKIEYVIEVADTITEKTDSELDFENLLKLIEEVKKQISEFSKKNLESIISL
ncbi:MAG: hypothetical protein QF436_02375 [Candidatus Woesearchaeota archaeon]|jgi:hypothetical protein|nr:hypothetical protein [Candidatus Woesearchaeota archaeon]MDP7622938.1 hypothetical protein [Candidatus Woesearchaeota archaeon]HJN57373.1 hypothetical protein [Candidatus Woesearchaeota archaeon]|tara:strand:- start:2267 stop:2833 length:567 start_codon:yes stop_codon:yes gene_type:complete